MALKAEEHRAIRTIKISRFVHQYLQSKATLAEPFDRTVRRELGLKLQKGEFQEKEPLKPKTKKLSEWTSGKVSEDTWNYITSKAQWNESVDNTLRRLFKLEQNGMKKK